jgi:YesN/AraC family two-component response regulator
MKQILIVDDEPRTREGIAKTLKMWASGRYEISTASSGLEAMTWLKEHEAQLLITDIKMPEMSGLDLVEQLKRLSLTPVVIILSGYSDFEYARRALKNGVVDYLLKPIDKGKLIQAVEGALKKEEWNEQFDRMKRLVDPKLLEVIHQDKTYNSHVQKALDYIDDHFQEQISMKQIADHLHMNASYFSVLFKEQTGITFSDYVTRHRIQKAKRLLTTTHLSVSEVAERVGYQTAKYFVKVFRMFEEVSPSQYRQQWLEDEQKIQ